MFAINPDQPADIKMVGEPVSSEGEVSSKRTLQYKVEWEI